MAATDTMTGEAVAPAVRLAPVAPGDRIFNLDMLRGWAILGILAVNAITFAWPISAGMSEAARPYALTGIDAWGHWVTDVFFEDKFRTLFTMLFGVSIYLVGGERFDESRGKLLRSRLFWLAVFGLIHGLAIWCGDILLHYAYCGLLMMMMRSMKAGKLIWIGGGITLLWMLMSAAAPLAMNAMPPEFMAKVDAGQAGVTAQTILATVEAYHASASGAWIENAKAWMMVQGFSLFLVPVTVPLMMLGLGLFKSGFFSGRAPVWVYLLLVVATAANLWVFATNAWVEILAGPGEHPTRGLASAAGGLAPLVTLGYASMLILMTRFGLKFLTGVLAPVGRMAFTNYLTQSIIMASLFYLPWGPHWMGTMGPGQLWGVVGAVWVAQLIWSPIWLSVFQMGPLEWLWRCLTYGRLVSIRKAAVA
ncbi:DUF418 domain-containing protein [Brevundimonas lenta]|uniref:DUF418 domain-containing protein n=1 Tax=Brevundimonas lenta TaxID=424796 RepID=A0A7W6J9U8_9CAUL|nr:DUF418 domain-containing protein [Brevundimonas lenta]MBB4081173.1 uncharacterized protein [Brevundimonas lenta]